MNQLTVEKLAELLKQAKNAHAQYEKAQGKTDDNWPQWYAAYIIENLATSD